MTATYLHRSTFGGKTAKRRKPAQLPAVDYPPGFFSEPVRAWKQMRFESRWGTADKPVPTPQRGIGFDRHNLNLPGAQPFVDAGPVEMMDAKGSR